MVECDEVQTFVQKKQNRWWIWLALDRHTREIVGLHVNQRTEKGAKGLWESLLTPFVDAECHTDALGAYKAVVFGGLHHVGGTQHMERFNLTLRQRMSRLVRRNLAFSKRLDHLIAHLWLFAHQYNQNRRSS